MKKILLTGGSGFIGTNLTDTLLANNYTLLNLDLAKPLKESHFNFWRKINILDYKNLKKEVLEFQPEIIIHLAAVTDLNGKDLQYYSANHDGTKNIIDICSSLPGLKRVLFTSSMYVCQPGYFPVDYNDYQPHTIYGESKVLSELHIKEIDNSNYDWAIVRPTSIWGPWFSIPYIDFFAVVNKKRYFRFEKSCTKTYGYIENTSYQILKLITATDIHRKTFYLGDYQPIQISEWASEISEEMGKGKIRKIPYLVLKSAALMGDFLAKLGLNFPLTSFRLTNMTTNNVLPLNEIQAITGPLPFTRQEGVKKTVKWLVEHKGYSINA
jgi:GlcNAc-P-P-Und epimerase